MIIERDLPIPMDDGIVLRADLFRPEGEGQFPVVMTMGPYAKGLRYQEGYAAQWQWLINAHPEVLDSSTGSYLTWETVDPERWVPAGYAVGCKPALEQRQNRTMRYFILRHQPVARCVAPTAASYSYGCLGRSG